MENNDLVTDPTDVSNSFNKYYSSIAGNILNNRHFVGDGNLMKYTPDPLPNSIFLEKVDPDEVEKLIKGFYTNKGTGPFSIPPKIMNNLVSYLNILLRMQSLVLQRKLEKLLIKVNLPVGYLLTLTQ